MKMDHARLAKVLLLSLCVAGCHSPPDQSKQAGRTKAELAHDILKLRFPADSADLMRKRIRDNLDKLDPEVADKATDALLAEGVRNAIIGAQAPIYEEHFSQEELADLLKFYESGIYDKLVRFQVEHIDELRAAQAQVLGHVIDDIVEKARQEQWKTQPRESRDRE